MIRKGIHLSSIVIPVTYLYIPRDVALLLLIPLTVCFVTVDIARYYLPPVAEWFTATFGWLLRPRETDRKHKRLNGASYVLLSGTIAVLVFPKLIAVTCFVVLIVSDMAAALIGKRFGRHRFSDKSIEGSAAFIVAGMLALLVLPKIEYRASEYIVGGAAVIVGAVAEALPWDVDDNLSIPLVVGAALWLGYALLLPDLPLHKF